MISPFKAILGDSYKGVEKRLEEAIHLRFGLPARTPKRLKDRIKEADRICAWHEAVQLAGFSAAEADRFFGHPPGNCRLTLVPEPPDRAQGAFLTRHAALLAEIEAAHPA